MDKKTALFVLALLASALTSGPALAAPHLEAVISSRTAASHEARLPGSRARAKSPAVNHSDLCLGAASAGCSGVLNAVLMRVRRPSPASTPGLEVHRADVEKILGSHPMLLTDAAATSAAVRAGTLPFRDQQPLVRRVEKISKEGIQFVRMQRRQQGEFSVGISRKGTLGFLLKTSSD